MPIGMVGTKLGMTRVFTEAGKSIPVTVVHAPKNYVTQVKTPETDGYLALQLSAGNRKPSATTKAIAGHYAKAGVTQIGRTLFESRITPEEVRQVGDTIGVDTFEAGEKVNVVGVSKGKGFAGAVKRHNFRTQDATHGNSLSHRALGSTGQCQFPGRVFKGKKMAGQMGAENVTTKNLEVVSVDVERDLLIIKGSVPGFTGGQVCIKHQKIILPPEPEPTPEEEPQTDETQQPSAEAAEAATDETHKTADETPTAETQPTVEETNQAEASAESEAEASDDQAAADEPFSDESPEKQK